MYLFTMHISVSLFVDTQRLFYGYFREKLDPTYGYMCVYVIFKLYTRSMIISKIAALLHPPPTFKPFLSF